MKHSAVDCALLRLLPSLFLILASCGEPMPQNQSHFTSNSNLASGQRNIGVDVIKPIRSLAQWTAPQEVWNETFSTNFNYHIFGPELTLSANGNRFISVHKAFGVEPGFRNFLQQDGLVFYNTPTTEWVAETPFVAGTTNTSFSEIKFLGKSDDAYAVWAVDGDAYINTFVADKGWQTQTLIGPAQDYFLLVDSKNNAYIVWRVDNIISIAQYSAAGGLKPAESFEALNLLSFTMPVINNDVVVVGWIAYPDFNDQFFLSNLVKLNHYVPGTGWGTITSAPPASTSNSMANMLILGSLANDQTLAITQLMPGTIYGNVYDQTNASWGEWQNVDYNIDRHDVVASMPRLLSSVSGEALVIWSERVMDNLGNYEFRVYTNSYNPVADSLGSHWHLPLRVGTVTPSPDMSFDAANQLELHPRLALNTIGQAVALWIEETATTETMYAKSYTASAGWSDIADTIVTYDKATDGFIRDPDIKINDNGKVSIIWRQRKPLEFADEQHVWVSDSQI